MKQAGFAKLDEPREAHAEPNGSRSKALLTLCAEIAGARISRALREATPSAEDNLLKLAEASRSSADQRAFFDAMTHLREQRASVVTGFGQHFGELVKRRVG